MHTPRQALVTALLSGLLLEIAEGQWIQTGYDTWIQTEDSYHGFVQCFAVEGTYLFAETLGGGVFLSTDSGSSWTQVNSGLTNTQVFALAVSGTNLFAGTV